MTIDQFETIKEMFEKEFKAGLTKDIKNRKRGFESAIFEQEEKCLSYDEGFVIGFKTGLEEVLKMIERGY